jgi:hypothetical protein
MELALKLAGDAALTLAAAYVLASVIRGWRRSMVAEYQIKNTSPEAIPKRENVILVGWLTARSFIWRGRD